MRMTPTRINDFCTLYVDDTNWGGADISALIQVFRSVIDEYEKVSGIYPPGVLHIFPDPGFGNPKCCKTGDYYTIYLTARGNYWSQYVYQFSHEYCHFLINGPLDGELETTFWFEESICELASMYFLNRTTLRWRSYNPIRIPGMPISSQQDVLQRLKVFAPKQQKYLANLRNENPSIDTPLYFWLDENMSILSEPVYHRNMYNQIANLLLDLFIDYPDLWKLLPFLYRPTPAEYSGFHDFITQVLTNRLSIEVEHLPQFVDSLTGNE